MVKCINICSMVEKWPIKDTEKCYNLGGSQHTLTHERTEQALTQSVGLRLLHTMRSFTFFKRSYHMVSPSLPRPVVTKLRQQDDLPQLQRSDAQNQGVSQASNLQGQSPCLTSPAADGSRCSLVCGCVIAVLGSQVRQPHVLLFRSIYHNTCNHF